MNRCALYIFKFIAFESAYDCVRALGERKQLEYAPWAVAAPLLLRVRALLSAQPARAGCAVAWRDYVRKNVTMPWVGSTQQAMCAVPMAYPW